MSTIILSAGHNPKAQGASNGDDFTEYLICTEWVRIIQELIDPIIPCILVPTGSLNSKVKFINKQSDAVMIVELHFNSNNKKAKGVEALYHPNSSKGKLLAEALCDGFEKRELFMPNRGAKIGYYQMNPEKPIDFLLRKTNPVACIFEPEFISHKKKIIDNKETACFAIADILIEFATKELGVKV